MKFSITPSQPDGKEELRTLLIDAAGQLAGSGAVLLEPRLPWDGNPILLRTADHRPVVVSFDADDSEAALINGLRSMEQLTTALPWLQQVYEGLHGEQDAAKLVIVGNQPPPGAGILLGAGDRLRLFGYRLLKINGETAILLEEAAALRSPEQPPAGVQETPTEKPAQVQPVRDDGGLPPLSREEARYFRQL